ncbi:MAG TPA: AAA family ATPase [Polyangiaceae bacterium]|nr:AAA family ATPase [Polyangiaceae bacterium]
MPAQSVSPPLEGRDSERAQLRAALDAACAGHGRIVVLSGEAGIGKSSLLGDLAGYAAERGITPVWGRAWEFADAPAYFPLWPCLSALGLPPESRQASAFTLWEAVLGALSTAALSEPRLWLIEDVHAADLQTLDLLAFLAQPLRVLKALVVVTARQRDARLSERAEQRLLRLARDGTDLRLAPLAPDEVERLARRHAGELPPKALRELLEITSGNPLFVVECARAIKVSGFHALRGVSPTIRQVVLERLQLLPDEARQLLESGSVLGRELSAALLARMHDVLPARVVDALLPALKSGVILERAPGNFGFSHVLVQSAIYESLPAERRALLHVKAERALRSLPDAPEVLLERARHALSGVTPATEAAALELVNQAARSLEASHAFDRAHALYGRVREKVATGELSRGPSGEQLLHHAAVAERAGRAGESRSLSLAVLQSALEQRDFELYARAALELGRGLRPGLIDAELVTALQTALQHFPDEASPTGCRLQARLAAALQPAMDPSGPVAMAGVAIERARKLGDPALLLEVLDVAGSALVEFAPLPVRLQAASALLEQATLLRDLPRLQRARARLAFERATLGDFDAFDIHVADMLRDAELLGSAQARIRPLLMASLAAVNRGNAAESDSLLAEVGQLIALVDDPGLALSYRAHGFSRAWLLHRDEEMEVFIANAQRNMVGVPAAELTLAFLRGAARARCERPELAAPDLRAVYRGLGLDTGSFVSLVAETAAVVKDLEICRACYERLRPESGHDALGGHVSVSYEGPIDRLLGLLQAALGQHDDAEQKLRGALALAERRGFRAWVAQGHYDLARFLAERGRAAEARRAFHTAGQLGEECQMPGLVARAHAHLSGTEAPPVSVARPAAALQLVMSKEGELYRLERGGLSVRIRASRGAELLARLVDAPGQEIHVLALAADEAPTVESNAGDSVDRSALRQYKARLQELSELLADAEQRADSGRAEALRREQAALEREVSRALGLGGKVRQAGSTSERARVNVQRRLKDTLERVMEASPELGAWLTRSVRTGTYCSFCPSV